MKTYELTVPCHFGLRISFEKRNNMIWDMKSSEVEDGRVTFIGDAEAICRANIFLRTTERVLLRVGKFKADDI